MIIYIYNAIVQDEYKYLDILYYNKNYIKYDENKYDRDSKLIILYYFDLQEMNRIVSNKKYTINYKYRHNNNLLFNEKITKLLKYKNCKILFLNDWETRDLANKIYEHNIYLFIKSYNLNNNKVLMSTNEFININKNIKNYCSLISYDWLYLKSKFNYKKYKKSLLKTNKNKYFIYLNRRNSDERLCLAIYLYKKYKNILNLSYLDKNIKGINKWLEKYIPYDKLTKFNLNISIDDYDNFCTRLPFIIDNNSYCVKWNQYDTIINLMDDSYIMIIFETNMEQNIYQQISEKTYKPINFGIPFIIFTKKRGILEYLKKVGFKTFEPYIIEDYDNLNLSYYERYTLLAMEIDRLANMSKNEIKILYEKCAPIIKHNWGIIENNFIPKLI